MELTAFRPEHGEQVRALIIGIQRDEFGVPITLEEQPDLFEIPTLYQHGVGGFWVALHEGRVVGTIGLFELDGSGPAPRAAALRKMFVAPEFRGRPHRTAQRLLEMLLAHAAKTSLEEIALGTTGFFLAAHRFYEKNGFDEIPKAALPPGWPHNAVDVKFYRRRLPPRG